MLKFDDFHSDGGWGASVWAEDARRDRVIFTIDSKLLVDVLGVENPVHHGQIVSLCEGARTRIEAACQNALKSRAMQKIELLPLDFDR